MTPTKNLKMRTRLASEQGWALVTALLLMAMMMSAGLAVATYVDNEGNQSRIGRNRESAFNLAEGALNAQVFALAQGWPGAGVATVDQYTACTGASGGIKCPNNAQLLSMFPTSDVKTGATWQTTVRDNNVTGAPNFYSDTLTANAPGYDYNNDGTVWVRAQATAKGKLRKSGCGADCYVFDFGDPDQLKAAINDAGVKRFGSGWTWLVADGGALSIVSTPNQDNPLMEGKTAILGIDVWEHAYYLKYQNRRPDYLAAWWDVVDWDEVGRRFEAAGG